MTVALSMPVNIQTLGNLPNSLNDGAVRTLIAIANCSSISSVEELARLRDLTVKAIKGHLRLLVEAGLVSLTSECPDGRKNSSALDDDSSSLIAFGISPKREGEVQKGKPENPPVPEEEDFRTFQLRNAVNTVAAEVEGTFPGATASTIAKLVNRAVKGTQVAAAKVKAAVKYAADWTRDNWRRNPLGCFWTVLVDRLAHADDPVPERPEKAQQSTPHRSTPRSSNVFWRAPKKDDAYYDAVCAAATAS